jgi:predicted transcriptional regulator
MAYITKKSKKPEMLGDVGFTIDENPEYIKKKEKTEYIKKKEKKNWITKKKKNWITKKSKNIDKFFGDIEF